MGGKATIASELRPWTHSGARLVSPFLGGGAVELDALAHGIPVVTGDIDPDLIQFWKYLKHKPRELHQVAQAFWPEHPVSRSDFDTLIEGFNTSSGLIQSAYFFALQIFGFNGQGRKAGFGKKDSNYQTTLARLQYYCLDDFDFECREWSDTLALANDNDAVYLDPPYPGYSYYDGKNNMDWNTLYETLKQANYTWLMTLIPTREIHTQFEEFFINDIDIKHRSKRYTPIRENLYGNTK